MGVCTIHCFHSLIHTNSLKHNWIILFVVPKLSAGIWVGWPRCQTTGLKKMKHSLHPFIIEASWFIKSLFTKDLLCRA